MNVCKKYIMKMKNFNIMKEIFLNAQGPYFLNPVLLKEASKELVNSL